MHKARAGGEWLAPAVLVGLHIVADQHSLINSAVVLSLSTASLTQGHARSRHRGTARHRDRGGPEGQALPSGRQEGVQQRCKHQDALLASLRCVAGDDGDPSPATPPQRRIPCSGFWHGHKSKPHSLLAEEGGDAPLPQPVLINVPGSLAAAAPACPALLFGVGKDRFGLATWLRAARRERVCGCEEDLQQGWEEERGRNPVPGLCWELLLQPPSRSVCCVCVCTSGRAEL